MCVCVLHKCCTLLCYLDNRSAVCVMAHNTSVLCRLRYFHNETVVGVISDMFEEELGERNYGSTP